MSGKYSERVDNGPLKTWYVERLWKLAATLPVKRKPIADISGFQENTWFYGTEPTCMEVTKHAQRILKADLTYPVILSAGGGVMDGMHRIARAWLDGQQEIGVVQFEIDPEPDEINP